jgi:hypothetical protein
MNYRTRTITALLTLLPLFAAPGARADTPTATIAQLSGWVMAVKADGKVKALATGSKVEAGDTLVTEKDSFARLALGDSSETVLGPQTTLKVERRSDQGTAFSLAAGSLQVAGRAGGITVNVGGTTIAGAASYIVNYLPSDAQALAAAQQLYLRSSLAAATPAVLSDAGTDMPLREIIAQAFPAMPKAAGLPSGLYVSVIDGAINLSNKGGSTNFSAGQFGYTASVLRPPMVLPANPGLNFTPPPAFSSSKAPATSTAGGKAGPVDCEVR